MPTYHDKRSHLDFKVCLKQSRLSIKLRGKISHACKSVMTILTTTRRKQLQGTSYNLEKFVMLTFCFSWFSYCNPREGALLFQQLYHFLITEEEFIVRRTNVAHDLGPNETAKLQR